MTEDNTSNAAVKQNVIIKQQAEQPNIDQTIKPLSNTDVSPETYTKEDKVITIFTYLFFLYSIATIIAFALGLSELEAELYGNYIYYSAMILYQISIISLSYLSYQQSLKSLPYIDGRTYSWYELVFYFKFAGCSAFNFLTCILLIVGLIRDSDNIENVPLKIIMAISYFMNVFSIPLPGLIFFRFQYIKKTIVGSPPSQRAANSKPNKVNNKTSLLDLSNNIDYTSQPKLSNISNNGSDVSEISLQGGETGISNISRMNLRKNRLFDRDILKAITCVYCVHFLSYVLYPAVHKDEFDSMLKILYIDAPPYQGLYSINHIFLRTFVGMSLNGLFFVFLAGVVAKYKENYDISDSDSLSDWELVTKCVRKNWKYFSIIIFVAILAAIFDLYSFSQDMDDVIDIFWIIINFIGILIGFQYRYLLKGAHRKHTIGWNNRFGSRKQVDNLSYGLRAVLLFLLFVVQLIFLLDTDNQPDWYRMISMLAFAIIQFFTLTKLRSVQTNDEYYNQWCKKENRERSLKWIYFRFLILVNVIDLLFAYIYSNQYYTVDKLESITKSVSYAMAFASVAIFTISLSQLVISYAKFDLLRGSPQTEMVSPKTKPVGKDIE
eukprot:274397_1